MTLNEESVRSRLKELDTVAAELRKYRHTSAREMQTDLSRRWVVERGLLAGAAILFDVLDHILAAQFSLYPETYEETLRVARERGLLSSDLYADLKGLGAFRNILVHEYVRIDVDHVQRHLARALDTFPRFIEEMIRWLEQRARG